MSKILAVTGGIGSGKTEACRVFSELGVPVVDLDQIAYAMSAPGSAAMMQVREAFGSSFFDENGNLLRSRLRELVFAKPDALDQLNQIMHPAIRYEALRQIAAHALAKYVVLAIPLLVESRSDWNMLDHVLLIDCDESIQLQRVMQRSHLSADMVQAMMAAQSTRQARLDMADTVIENQGNLEDLAEKISDFHKNYSNTC